MPSNDATSPLRGTLDPRFTKLQSLLTANLQSGAELGFSLAVHVHGQPVIDLWGGYSDTARTIPWQHNTITQLYSLAKPVGALVILLLASRGQLSLDAPVAKYWPEFAAKGKENILIRHVLSHASGVPGWTDKISVSELCETDAAVARLADQEPWWKDFADGTTSGYHGYTQGMLIGEIVRRVTGRRVKDFIAEEIAQPLGADYRVGRLIPEEEQRVSDGVRAPVKEGAQSENASQMPDPESIAGSVMTNPGFPIAEMNEPLMRHADLGSNNAHSNARGVAQILDIITQGGQHGGKQLLDPAVLEQMLEVQVNTPQDLVLGRPMRWGLGVSLMNGEDAAYEGWMPKGGRLCHWGGYGGAVGIADAQRGVTVTYVPNQVDECIFMDSSRTQSYVRAVYEVIGAAE